MISLSHIELGIALLSMGIWVGLLGFWGQFWRCDQQLSSGSGEDLEHWPSVWAVIPARNEADLLPQTLRSLLTQDYPGKFQLILVDDQSTDGTATVARQTAQAVGKEMNLQILTAQPLPPGWSGKLWAVEQGIQAAQQHQPDYLLLTDADIVHDPSNLRQLVTKAEQDKRELVSLMVSLRCTSFWERFLIPAFVFFFQKLYPFPWVNQPQRRTAAAAGGCILVQAQALAEAGGIETVRQALIDDCALAAAIKHRDTPSDRHGRIWLGLSRTTHSLRPYPSLESIWDMVARTAFTQLNYSPWLLLGALLGMILVYLVAPLAVILGLLTGQGALAIAGLLTWLLMSIAYLPTVRLYGISPLWAVTLPAIALLYNLMTLDSALRHWQGKGGAWKGRVYDIPKTGSVPEAD
jgi:hopene-associated glycosyltransferase HpnB